VEIIPHPLVSDCASLPQPLQLASLENQSARDAATINTLTSEIRKITASIGDTNAELAKLKKTVSTMQFVLLQPLSYSSICSTFLCLSEQGRSLTAQKVGWGIYPVPCFLLLLDLGLYMDENILWHCIGHLVISADELASYMTVLRAGFHLIQSLGYNYVTVLVHQYPMQPYSLAVPPTFVVM